jgi:PadR family transcriptional regulator
MTDVLPGTLDLLVLKTLALEPMHGWGIAQRIQALSREVFLVPQGSLYPALVRLKRRGLVTSSWRTTEAGRRARYYALTAAGHRQLVQDRAAWHRTSSAVNWVLEAHHLAGGAA